jgi:hypothetical protein
MTKFGSAKGPASYGMHNHAEVLGPKDLAKAIK